MRTAISKVEELIEYIEAQYGWEGSYMIRPDQRIALYFQFNEQSMAGVKLDPSDCVKDDFIRLTRNRLINTYHHKIRKVI